VSPFRPSFSPHPQQASIDHRFLSPLFSKRYELLFPQLSCFHKHLRCPLVFSSRCIFPRLTHKTLPRVTTFRMNTCKSVSKQKTLSPFRMNTYAKGGGGGTLRASAYSAPARRVVGGSQRYHLPLVTCPLFSSPCRLFVYSLRPFPHSDPLFSVVCSLFYKITQVGVSSELATRHSFTPSGAEGSLATSHD